MATKKHNKKKNQRQGRQSAVILAIVVILVIAAIAVLLYLNRDKVRDYIDKWFDDISTSDEDSSRSESSDSLSGEDPSHSEILTAGDVEIHFLELGNKYTGDCTYIRVGDIDILIDAGSRQSSAATISAYLDRYITDGVIEYVIATHAHQDHIAGFVSTQTCDSIFKRYECKNIIDFALTNAESKIYTGYIAERNAEVEAGATHYTAAEMILSDKAEIDFGNGMKMTILDNYYYYNESSDENNYSVCMLLTQGSFHYLFTGDLEADGEKRLVQLNDLPEVELFKAGHHGSYTATTDALLSVIKPKRVAVCCCAGSTEYTKNPLNTFPSQAFCDRVAPYTKEVYVTTMATDTGFKPFNGNIIIEGKNGIITVTCSENNTWLCYTAWFKENRTCPPEWKNED